MRFRQTIDYLLGSLLITIMSIMVINVLWQVFSRYLLNDPSSFTDELARYLMIWVGILGAAYVSGKNMHVAIDIVPSRMNEKLRAKLENTVRIVIILFSLFSLVLGGGRLVYITYILEQYSPALNLPLSLIYMVLPISGIIIIYYKVSEIYKPN